MNKEKLDFKDEIKKQIIESASLKKEIIEKHADTINDIAIAIINAYKNNKKVIWFGNGGSAADAQHLSCELVSKFLIERKALFSIALTTNTSILTAVSNDYSFEKVFARQVEAYAEKGDIILGITTSGTSPNVLEALDTGKKIGAITVAFTGQDTSKIKNLADYLVDIPSKKTPRIQEAHIMIGHIICEIVEKKLFAD